jgi:hypothetical protein
MGATALQAWPAVPVQDAASARGTADQGNLSIIVAVCAPTLTRNRTVRIVKYAHEDMQGEKPPLRCGEKHYAGCENVPTRDPRSHSRVRNKRCGSGAQFSTRLPDYRHSAPQTTTTVKTATIYLTARWKPLSPATLLGKFSIGVELGRFGRQCRPRQGQNSRRRYFPLRLCAFA